MSYLGSAGRVTPVLVLTQSTDEATVVDGVAVICRNGVAAAIDHVVPGGHDAAIDPVAWASADYALPTLVAAARTIFDHEPLPQISAGTEHRSLPWHANELLGPGGRVDRRRPGDPHRRRSWLGPMVRGDQQLLDGDLAAAARTAETVRQQGLEELEQAPERYRGFGLLASLKAHPPQPRSQAHDPHKLRRSDATWLTRMAGQSISDARYRCTLPRSSSGPLAAFFNVSRPANRDIAMPWPSSYASVMTMPLVRASHRKPLRLV